MIEKEFKFLVNEKIFNDLLREVSQLDISESVNEKIQINYYYDTDGFDLYRQNTTLRIRQVGESLRLEVKNHTGNHDGYQISTESYHAVPNIAQQIWTVPQVKLGLEPFCYKLQGSLTTHRTSILCSDGSSIDFDRNYYLGICDYEIEIEFRSGIEKIKKLADFLKLYEFNPLGKYTRFFHAKEKLNYGIAI